MQKRKFIPLSMLLLCSLCLGACSCGKPSEENVVAVIGDKKITAEYIYDTSLYNSDVAEYIYGVLEKELIKSVVGVSPSMQAAVENEVEAFVNKLKLDAQLNSTNYKEDLEKTLQEEGVKTLDELKEKKLYALQKQAAKTMFLDKKSKEYATKYINENFLYHIGDINVSISGSSNNATDLYSLTLSTDQATSIHDAILELVNGYPYYDVALNYSNADSKKNGGDEGIVTLYDADITDELRYALFGYSAIIERKYDELETGLGIADVVEANKEYNLALTELYHNGIESIPLSYIKGLEGNYEKTECYTDKEDRVYSSSKVYYRNILFNNLLNTKTPRFITLTADEVLEHNAQDRVVPASDLGVKVLVPDAKKGGYIETNDDLYVLMNEENKPYVVYRDKNGLHIMTIHMTPFTEDYNKYFSNQVDENDEYYIYAEQETAEITSQERLDEVNKFATQYITNDFGNNTADENLLDIAIFEYFMEQTSKNGNFKIVDENIKEMINQYMNASKDYAEYKTRLDVDGYYKAYSNMVWFRRIVVAKEVPLLSCLEKDSKGNNKCTYKYKRGFAYYTTDEEGGSN